MYKPEKSDVTFTIRLHIRVYTGRDGPCLLQSITNGNVYSVRAVSSAIKLQYTYLYQARMSLSIIVHLQCKILHRKRSALSIIVSFVFKYLLLKKQMLFIAIGFERKPYRKDYLYRREEAVSTTINIPNKHLQWQVIRSDLKSKCPQWKGRSFVVENQFGIQNLYAGSQRFVYNNQSTITAIQICVSEKSDVIYHDKFLFLISTPENSFIIDKHLSSIQNVYTGRVAYYLLYSVPLIQMFAQVGSDYIYCNQSPKANFFIGRVRRCLLKSVFNPNDYTISDRWCTITTRTFLFKLLYGQGRALPNVILTTKCLYWKGRTFYIKIGVQSKLCITLESIGFAYYNQS